MLGHSDPAFVRAALDLIGLLNNESAAIARLAASVNISVRDAVQLACPSADATTRAAAARQMTSMGVVDGDYVDTAHLADLLALCVQLRAELERRRPPATSQLVVTATSAVEVEAFRNELGLRPLVHLVQDVVRAADSTCTLGAPYWNVEAVTTLWPALEGLAARGGRLELICQGTIPDGDPDPRPALRRVVKDMVMSGGHCELWTFDVRDATGAAALLHAKFALADRSYGYLGSANMTKQGFGRHFEIGVQLGAAEAQDLAALVERLKYADLLRLDS